LVARSFYVETLPLRRGWCSRLWHPWLRINRVRAMLYTRWSAEAWGAGEGRVSPTSSSRLSHVDCKRPHVLTPEERALVFVYCSGHVVARCPACDVSFRYMELAADVLGGSRTNMCPRCRQDLTEAVRAHLFRCAMLPSEIRLRAQAVREAAQRLVKETQQVLIREAEAALFEKQLRSEKPCRREEPANLCNPLS